MPELLTVWLVLALGAVAAWCVVKAAYSRGFSDGQRVVFDEITAEAPVSRAEVDAWINAGPRQRWFPTVVTLSADYWVVDTRTKARLRLVTVEPGGLVSLAANEDVVPA